METTEELMTAEEAVKFVKASRNRKIFIMSCTGLPSKDKPEQEFYRYTATIPVTAPAAVRWLKDMGPLAEKTSVRVSVTDRCLFLGSTI